jgi:biopolymer transport protein ExbB/TolQ
MAPAESKEPPMNEIISDTVLKAVEQGILGLLLAMGVACAALFTWRWRIMGLSNVGMRKWRDRLAGNLTAELPRDDQAAKPAAGEAGAADRLIRLGLDNAHLCPEALEKVLETQETRERHLMERGAQFLGTVGANAPFLGLTGTVLGILSAFRQMASQGGNGGVEVMSAIAGALIATAIGLIVAIPAVVLYNLLKARIRKTMDGLGELRNLLLARSLQAVAKETF